MKILIGIILVILLVSCTCQQEGAYEKCVAEGHALCIDIYPKCKPCE